MSAPTPWPWRLWSVREGEGNLAIEHLPPCWVGIESMNGVGALGQAVAAGFGPANAELIVRAVNAHEALVAAVEEALEELHCTPSNEKELHEMAPGEFAQGHWCPRCDESVDRNGELRAKLRAALAQVKP